MTGKIVRTSCALVLASAAGFVAARTVRVHLDSMSLGPLTSGTVELMLDADSGRLNFDVGGLDWQKLGLAGMHLSGDCMLAHRDSAWRCVGSAHFVMVGKAKVAVVFSATLGANLLALDVHRGDTTLALATDPAASFAPLHLRLDALPLRWFEDLLATQLPGLILNDGRLDTKLELRSSDKVAVNGEYTLHDLAFDSRDGVLAGAKLGAGGKITISADSKITKVHHEGALRGGELLLGSFYVALPERVVLGVDAMQEGVGWRFDRLTLDDPGVLRAEAKLHLGAKPAVQIDTVDAVFPVAYERYAKSLLAPRGLGELEIRGRLRGNVDWTANGLSAFIVRPQNLSVKDKAGRFAIDDLNGALDWRRDVSRPATKLSWHSAELYRLALGPAEFDWRTNAGALQLITPLSVPLFGGAIELPRFTWQPDAASGSRIDTALAVHGVELATVTRALGWPEFGGTLGGAVPQIHYGGDRIKFDGGLSLAVFDGTIDVTNVVFERPFGVAPSLAADIALTNLDLQRLTSTFDFGEITGRLSGKVASLRLVDWSPVAFDAELHAFNGGRLSQRAVNGLSSVGGGGFAAGLQTRILRIFDTFGYSRLGVSCRLANNVCHMSGLAPSGNGYAIVEGRGLPRISVIGHQQHVDWPTLVERLKAATSGTTPVIQ